MCQMDEQRKQNNHQPMIDSLQKSTKSRLIVHTVPFDPIGIFKPTLY